MNFACIRPERAVSRPSGYSHVRSINQSSPFVNGAAIFPPAQQRKPFPRFFAETVSRAGGRQAKAASSFSCTKPLEAASGALRPFIAGGRPSSSVSRPPASARISQPAA